MKCATLLFAAGSLALALAFAGCQSTKVSRVDAGTDVTVNEYWDDTDIRTVCDSLIEACVQSKGLENYQIDLGRRAFVTVGHFANESSEAIDTTIISKTMEDAIVNNGVVRFVTSRAERDELREEKLDQAENASMETAASIGNEIGADLVLTGTVKSVVSDSPDRKSTVRTYYVFAQLKDVETGELVWSGNNSEIKKVITRKAAKL